MGRVRGLARLLALAAPLAPAAAPPPAVAKNGTHNGWSSYCIGAVCDGAASGASTSAGVSIIGGGGDVDDAFLFQIQRSGDGNFLIFVCSGGDDPLDPPPDPDPAPYNPYVWELGGGRLRSVTTVVMDNRTAGLDPQLVALVNTADAVFFEGGDQTYYVLIVGDTPLGEALRARVRQVTVGGTSAGADYLGDLVFAPSLQLPDSAADVTSKLALSDPFAPGIAFGASALALEALGPRGAAGRDVFFVDTHVMQRDRLGRWLAFGARIAANVSADGGGGGACVRMLALNERSAMLVEPNGRATLAGPQSGEARAYLCLLCDSPAVCVPGEPLSAGPYECTTLEQGDAFDFGTWRGSPKLEWGAVVTKGSVERYYRDRGAV